MGLIAGLIILGATVRVARKLDKTISKKSFARDPHGSIQDFLVGSRRRRR